MCMPDAVGLVYTIPKWLGSYSTPTQHTLRVARMKNIIEISRWATLLQD